MASNLIAEEESLLLGRGDDLSGSKGGQQHQHQHHQQQKSKGGSLLVGGAPHKVDPVAERRKAKVSKRGESTGEEEGGRVWVIKLLAGIILEHIPKGEFDSPFSPLHTYSYFEMRGNLNNPRTHRPPLPSPFNPQALRVLETRLKKMAGNDAKVSSLKVGGKDQEIDLEASTTAKVCSVSCCFYLPVHEMSDLTSPPFCPPFIHLGGIPAGHQQQQQQRHPLTDGIQGGGLGSCRGINGVCGRDIVCE